MNLSATIGFNLGMAQKYESRTEPYLASGEDVLNAGKGIEMSREKTHGKSGDSILAFTNERVIVLYEDGNIRSMNHNDIASFSNSKVRTIVPKVREIHITSRYEQDAPILFHGGKTFAKEALLLLRTQRLVSDLVNVPTTDPFDPVEWIVSGLSGEIFDCRKSSEYLSDYKLHQGSARHFDFMPLRNTEVEKCGSLGESFREQLEFVRMRNVSGLLGHIQIAMELPPLRQLWNPYTEDGIKTIVDESPKGHRRTILDWCNLKHDLLEASFKAGWELIKIHRNDEAERVLAIGAMLSAGTDRQAFDKLNS